MIHAMPHPLWDSLQAGRFWYVVPGLETRITRVLRALAFPWRSRMSRRLHVAASPDTVRLHASMSSDGRAC